MVTSPVIDRYAPPDLRDLWSEAERYRVWLEVELAAVDAWETLGHVPRGTAAELREAAARRPLDADFARRVAQIEAETRHDIVAFTRALTERFGAPARFVHLGLTSTDVVDTAQNLLLVRAIDRIAHDLADVRVELREIAWRHRHTLCIGRTHGVHAEPMTFGLKFVSFDAAAARDQVRLAAAREAVAVAMLSGSVGTYAHVPPQVEEHVARQLGLAVDPVSQQTVARDRHAQLFAALAGIGTTIERVVLEVRHLQRSEVREVREGFAKGQTGSSSMPHKKNPIGSENLTGVARMLRSYLSAAYENVALWHERDISHSSVERVIVPDATTLACYALRRLAALVRDLVVDEERMQDNVGALRGLVYSQRVLHALIEGGAMREEAYEIVQRHALSVWEGGPDLRSSLASDPAVRLTDAELGAAFDPAPYLEHVDAIYARNGYPGGTRKEVDG